MWVFKFGDRELKQDKLQFVKEKPIRVDLMLPQFTFSVPLRYGKRLIAVEREECYLLGYQLTKNNTNFKSIMFVNRNGNCVLSDDIKDALRLWSEVV